MRFANLDGLLTTANSTPFLVMDYCPNETAIAHAPYVYLSGSAWHNDSMDAVFEQLFDEGLRRCRDNIAKWQGWADERGLKHLIYECGHHVEGSNHTFEITNDPRMTDLLLAFDELLPESVTRCYFNYGGKPRNRTDFGHMSFSGDVANPKWLGLQGILNRD